MRHGRLAVGQPAVKPSAQTEPPWPWPEPAWADARTISREHAWASLEDNRRDPRSISSRSALLTNLSHSRYRACPIWPIFDGKLPLLPIQGPRVTRQQCKGSNTMSSIFERHGGFARVSRIVSTFYDRVLDSPILSPYFEKTDMRRLIDHQTKFISSLMGGPASYSNETLERVHAHLSIDQESFDEMVLVLSETLEDFDMTDVDIQTVKDEILCRSRYIVTRQ